MWKKPLRYLLPYPVIYSAVLLAVTVSVLLFYRNIDHTFEELTDAFLRYQSDNIEEFARNIEVRAVQLVPDRPVETLKHNPALRERLNRILSLFSTKSYRYVYMLRLDDSGKLRYVADGSFEVGERGVFGQKFDPDSDAWLKALRSGEPVYRIQDNFTGLWITYYYPMKIWQKKRYLLVFDISLTMLESFKTLILPIRGLLKTISAVLIALLALSLLWAVLFYFQRRKNSIDPLTRLYNRNMLDEVRHRLDLRKTSVILADMDHFKRINDRYGHDTGDAVLRHAARILMRMTRPEDILIRYGGEEFLIFINGVESREDVIEIAYRIHNAFSMHPMRYNGHELQITVSMGVVPTPGATMDLSEAILMADKMLYIAKTTGRNKVVIFGEEKNAPRPLLYHEIEESIREERIFFLYQPIYDAESMELAKYEVLARIRDKEGNVHLPNEFIPVIRGTGAYREMSKHLINDALALIREKGVSLSINFDINDFLDETLFETIYDSFERCEGLTRQLTIELLEENPVHDMKGLENKIRQLKELDIEIAIDDYGKGYAGLEYILAFRPHILKVDRYLVSRVFSHPHVPAILESIVTTCRRIGIKTVAEGIDNELQLQKMRQLGFDYLQGFYLGKPSEKLVEEERRQ
ncbi:MAG: bifunctional diguanylate cyclase/phosphodiesterase [Epsilonproteobacteria bacterium]|nr:bifunctional diguanylate cyclase/phosphodiesterase [Campylobacterota bacterium]